MTSHKWRELVSSGPSVCRCHVVFLWCYISFALLRFCLYAFVEAAALRSIVLRYAGAPIATRVFFFFLLFIWRCRFFRVFFSNISTFSLYGEESTSYVFSFRMVFFYLVTTGWILCHSLSLAYVRNKKKRNLKKTLEPREGFLRLLSETETLFRVLNGHEKIPRHYFYLNIKTTACLKKHLNASRHSDYYTTAEAVLVPVLEILYMSTRYVARRVRQSRPTSVSSSPYSR